MIDTFTIGRKAAKYGYKKFGIPGAVLAGVGGVAGYRMAKKTAKSVLQSRADSDATAQRDVEPSGVSVDESASVSVPVDESEGEEDVQIGFESDDDGRDGDSAASLADEDDGN